MADVNISKYRASVVRSGSTPATPGFVVSEGQNPVEPAGSEQNHLPVTINPTATALSITTSQILSGAGTVGQYIRGDGSLADFPSSSGGGSSVSYYLNGSVSQGTIGGVAYKELNKVPILGSGTDFTINANGYIAQFLTDAGDPNLLQIPGGNWNFETYFSASSGGGSPTFYVELYKYDGSTFTLIASSSGSPELIAFGTTITSYFSTLAVPTTTLALTDRLAIRYYVTNSGRTITLHTENNHLCQVITTFTTGLTALNGLTAQVQNFAVGTSGTDFNISSATATHTFNLPTASGTNRGALSSADWTTFNNKQNALGFTPVPETRTITINGTSQDLSANRTYNVGTVTSVAALTLGTSGTDLSSTVSNGTTTPVITLNVPTASATNRGALSAADWSTFNSKQNAITLTTTGTSGAATLIGATLNIPQYQAAGTYVGSVTASSPLFSSGGTTPNITIQQASGSQSGFLSSTDWTTFNNKQNTITLTTTGSSGVATLIGSTLNIPNYGSALSGYLPLTGGTLTGALNGTSASFSGDITTTGSGFQGRYSRIFEAAGQRGGFYPYNIISGGGTDYSIGIFSESEIFLAPGGSATKRFTMTSTGAATFSSSVNVGGVSANTDFRIYRTVDAGAYLSISAPGGSPLVSTIGISGTNVMSLNQSGNVGIGTTSPNRTLTVSGTQGLIALNATSYRNTTIGSDSVGSFIVYDDTAAAYRMVISSTGNVLIGNTSAYTSRLTVQAAAGNRPAIKAGFGVVAGNGYWVLGDNYTLDESLTSYGIDYSSGDLVLGSIVAPSTTTSGAFISTQAQFGNLGSAIRAGNSGDIYFFRGTSTSVVSVGGSKSMTESMRLNSSGNLLVGTTTDNGARLQVSGDITTSNNTANVRVNINNTTTTTGRSWYLNSYSNGNLYVGNGTAGDIFNFSSTGAATFSSSVTLGGYLTGQGTNPGGLGGSRYVIDWNGGDMRLFSYGANSSTNGGFRFNSQRSDGTNSTDFLLLSSTGAATFSSSVTASSFNGNLIVGSATVGGQIKLDYGANVASRSWRLISDAYNYGDFSIQQSTTQTGSTYVDKLIISASGNVGIGTSSPGQLLTLSSSNTLGTAINIINTSSGGYNWNIFSGGSDATIGPVGSLIFRDSTNGQSRMLITSGGNVLIGTTTDNGARLQVSGTATMSGLIVSNSLDTYPEFRTSPSDADVFLGFTNTGDGNNAWGVGRRNTGEFWITNFTGNFNSGTRTTVLSLATTGAATFSSSVTATELYLSTSNGVVGNINSSAANGGYITWQTSGTTIADIGTAQQIFGTGGNDTFGINGRGARALTFGTNNTERLRITSSGNVGIGNTSPNKKLEITTANGVSDGIRITYNNVTTEGLDITYLNSGNTTINFDSIYNSNSALMQFRMKTGGTPVTAMTILGSGNVGIGNTSPQGLLQIGANALSNNADASNAFNLKQTSTTAETGIYLERSGERKGYYIYLGGSLDSLTFQRNNAGTKADVMSLTRDGNVGIGTSSPSQLLHIRNDQAAYTWARIDNQSSSSSAYSGLQVGAYGNTWGIAIGSSAANSNALTFVIDAGGGNTERMRITSGGNVLIGTTTDNSHKLRVNGTGYFDTGIKTGNPVGSTTNDWLLGRALVSGTSTPDRWIRVQIGNLYYDILAVYMGSV